jgi:mycothiol synthase
LVPPARVRRLTAGDLRALSSEVARARAAGEFGASSDPDGAYILKSFALDPTIFGGAFEGEELVAFVSPEFKVTVVRPVLRRRGIGRSLIELAAAMERERGRPNVIMGRLNDDDRAKSFLVATGFAFHSTLWDLDLPPDVAVSAAAWPDELRARPFDRTRDNGPWVDLFNAAFADHATPLQLDATYITADLDDPAIEDADTLLVEEIDHGELVGFCATAPIRRDGAVSPHGEIWTIGVRPDRQGRGLGRQLLRWGIGRLRSIGVADVTLSVNGRNEHALRLYEEEGFVRSRTRERWARPAAAVDETESGLKTLGGEPDR